MTQFKAIAAMSENRVIGAQGRIPWQLPEDLQWFKRLTLGQVVVMGRKTFESLDKPLPQRTIIVLSRSPHQVQGVRFVSSLDQIDLAGEMRDVFICGGAQLYAQTVTLWTDLYLTLVKRTVVGDAFFPPFETQFAVESVLLDRPEFRVIHYRRLKTAPVGPS